MADAVTARPTGLGSHDLLTADELALYLGCARPKAVEWAAERRLAMPTPGRGLRYLVADVVAALKADAAPAVLPVRRRRDAPSRADLDR